MTENTKKYINIQKLKVFFLSFALSVATIIGCRMLTTEMLNFSRDLGYVVSFSLLFALLTVLWSNKKHLLLCVVFIGIYLLSSVVKRCTGMILLEREITHTLGLAIILFSVVSLLQYMASFVKNKWFKYTLTTMVTVLCVLFLLPALIFLGYTAVNGGIFTSDIMLTLFQTNPEEVISYLQDRNLWHWGIGSVLIIVLIVLYCKSFTLLNTDKFSAVCFTVTLLWCVYVSSCILYKLNLSPLINIVQSTKVTLEGFDEFKQAQNERIARLKNLMRNGHLTADNGVYVLVIGESETKDHMGLYGYDRPTTPWLSEFAKSANTFVFENAYSNHTHTVPTLTYAFSEKNQYNDIDLSVASSIIEAAEAAGYKTYWLSNQAKYGVIDTPITTMASVSDVQHWLNVNSGDKIFTTYYDEKLTDKLPSMQEDDKVLIIVHLMGNHGDYRDRYPAEYSRFKGKSNKVDPYDNSVLYNDYVLQTIYDRVKNYPDFKAFVYFSDHGEDVDEALGHESSRFTYRMARIPLVVNVSEKFADERKEQVENMRTNKSAYWTNDLLYDLMISLMNIKGLPNMEERFDLLSNNYDLPREEVKLLHGQKNLQSEGKE